MALSPPSVLPTVILLWHGSRDRRAALGFEQLVHNCQTQLAPQPVRGCQLECGSVPLEQQLHVILSKPGISESAIVVPIFMGAGVHVRDDIPAAIAACQQQHPGAEIVVLPPLGQSVALVDVLRDRCAAYSEIDAWLIWGHGSRLPAMARGLDKVRTQLVSRLSGQPVALAFWAQQPTWHDAVRSLAGKGHRQIGILPCTWFAGSLVDRLAAEIRAWQSQHQDWRVYLADVLVPHPCWVNEIERQVRSCNALQSDPAA
ncbi:MAG: CbiX/SirB N-terminal domain-containing protein [Cyanobacteria bacterium P01_F01_bin.33]